jgi:hypothetical protein
VDRQELSLTQDRILVCILSSHPGVVREVREAGVVVEELGVWRIVLEFQGNYQDGGGEWRYVGVCAVQIGVDLKV